MNARLFFYSATGNTALACELLAASVPGLKT